MRVLLIHPNNLEEYHLERITKESLKTLQCEVRTLKYRETEVKWLETEIKRLSSEVDFTLVLKGEILTKEHYDAIDSFSGLWYVDHPKDGVLPEWFVLGCKNVDFVFSSSYALLEKIKLLNKNAHWIVEGAHLPLLQPQNNPKEYDLAFFGTLIAETGNGDVFGSRADFLSQLDKKYDLHLFGPDSDRDINGRKFNNPKALVWNEQLSNEISKSKIVLGYNSTNKAYMYWSNRLYTTLACRGFLITSYVPGIEKVFKNHEELVWFTSLEELYELIDYYLVNDEQREEIAERGLKKVQALFSTQKQVSKILELVEEKLKLFSRKKKILFVTDSGYVGCKRAIEHWAALLLENSVKVDHYVVDEVLPKEIGDSYDVVIVSGHSGKYDQILESQADSKYVVWQSSILQTQLESEFKQIKKIKELELSKTIDGVLCGDNNCVKLFQNGIWVPNFSHFKPKFSNNNFRIEGKTNISALGPSKSRKNLFTVLAALEHLSDDFVVHINVSEKVYKEQIEGIFDTSQIINHGWLEDEDYYALIKQCDFGVQLSVAESYDYVAAEHMLLGTPIICSHSVPAISIQDLQVSNHENSGELLAKFDLVRRSTRQEKQAWIRKFIENDKYRREKALQQLLQYVVGKKSCPVKASLNRPQLSIIYHGRNDNYAGEFKRRLAWSLATVRNAFKNLNPEVLFICWNTLPSTPFLFDEPLLKSYAKGIKTYIIPSTIHQELAEKHNYKGVYLEWYAKNFGLRRAQGEYILQINSDNIIVNDVAFNDLPDKETTYIGNRTEVGRQILDVAPENISFETLQSLKKRVLPTDLDRPYFVGGSCGEFVLSHRDNWYKICGNVETADRYCIDNVTATHLRMVSRLTHFQYPVYHIEHHSAPGKWPGFDFPIRYSGDNWGLPDIEIEPRTV